jgi:hypothetical protein
MKSEKSEQPAVDTNLIASHHDAADARFRGRSAAAGYVGDLHRACTRTYARLPPVRSIPALKRGLCLVSSRLSRTGTHADLFERKETARHGGSEPSEK